MEYIKGIDGKFYSIDGGKIIEIGNPMLNYEYRQNHCIDCLTLTSGNCGKHYPINSSK